MAHLSYYRKLVGKAAKLTDAGVIQKPAWLDAVKEIPPLFNPPDTKRKPKNITFKEDPYIQSFQDRYPHMKKEPVDLLWGGIPVARRYGLRMLELLESGMGKRNARMQVDTEFLEADLIADEDGDNEAMELTQLAEEAALSEALEESRNRAAAALAAAALPDTAADENGETDGETEAINSMTANS